MELAVPGSGYPALSIGDLSDRTGVAAATLRIWEARHGFPVPQRLTSGHRRYTESDVAAVQQVVRLRETGVRLEAAVARVRSWLDAETATANTDAANNHAASVYARLRHSHPALQPSRLTKRSLLAMSWAIEDEVGAQARRAHLFGAFQRSQHFESARDRWTDLARHAASTYVFADFEKASVTQPVEVPLAADSPMSREWSVVCDSPELAVALTAWELPGQSTVHDADRLFESMWTVDPAPVREAARVCAGLAVSAGAVNAATVSAELARPVVGAPDLAALTSLFNRSVAYVDRAPRR